MFSRGRAECIPHKVRLAKLEMASAAQADSLPLRPSETSIQRVWPLWGVKHVKHRHCRNSQEAFEISILQSTLGRLNHCESVGFNCSVHPEGAMSTLLLVPHGWQAKTHLLALSSTIPSMARASTCSARCSESRECILYTFQHFPWTIAQLLQVNPCRDFARCTPEPVGWLQR